MKYLLLLAFICLCPSFLAAKNPGLHTLVVYDPSPEISPISRMDVKRIKTIFKYISIKTKLRFTFKTVPKTQFSIGTLRTWLNSSQQTAKDVVLVYYVGKGLNSSNPKEQWPLITSQQNTFLSENEVAAEVLKHRPRFALVIFDCYNRQSTPQDSIYKSKLHQPTLSQRKDRPGLKTLFKKNTGMITISSGFPVSSCLYANFPAIKGGYFTNRLLRALYGHSKLKNAGWNLIQILSSLEQFGLHRPLFNYQNKLPSHIPIPRAASKG